MDVLEIASVSDFFYSWSLFLIPLTVSVLVIFLPGLLLGCTMGLQGRLLWGWAPAGSIGVIVLSAVIASRIGLKWGFPVLIIGCLIAAAIFWFILRIINRVSCNDPIMYLNRSNNSSSRSFWHSRYLPTVLLAVIFFSAVIRFAAVVKVPGAFAQIWDNVFHSNLAMMFLQSGDASSLKADLWNPGTQKFYPAAWHAIVALIASTCAGAVTVAANAFTLVIAFLVWPLGIFCLSSAFTNSRVTQLASIFISMVIPQFPYAFLSWGPLYPNLLSCALLPSVLALLVGLLKGEMFPMMLGLTALFWGIASIAASQPNNIFTLVIISAILVWWFGLVKLLKLTRDKNYSAFKRIVASAGWTVSCLAIFLLWEWGTYQSPTIKAMRTQAPYWLPQGSYWSGIKEILLLTGGKPSSGFALYQPESMLPFSVIFLTGMVFILLTRKHIELLLCWLPFALLALVGHSMQDLHLRQHLVGVWYSDSPRIYVPVAIFSILIISVGFEWLTRKVLKWVLRVTSKQLQTLILITSLIVGAGFTVNSPHLRASWEWIGDVFSIRDAIDTNPGMVDHDELKLFLDLPSHTPANSVILGNPWEGASFAWSIGQRRTIFPTLRFATSPEPSRVFLANKLYERGERKRICSFLKTKEIYVLNLRDAYSGAEGKTGIEKTYPSFDQIDPKLLTLVESVGEARLLKYRGC